MSVPHRPGLDDRRDAFDAVAAEVYEPLQRYLARRASPDDVDELLDDVLLVLWRRLDEVPAGRTLPWAYGIAHRCLANHRRGAGRRLRLVGRVGASTSHGAWVEWTSDADVALHEALGRLPELDREVVRLWAWERLEPREIAEVVGRSANAVSVRLHRILRRLGDEMARKDAPRSGHERVAHEGGGT